MMNILSKSKNKSKKNIKVLILNTRHEKFSRHLVKKLLNNNKN